MIRPALILALSLTTLFSVTGCRDEHRGTLARKRVPWTASADGIYSIALHGGAPKRLGPRRYVIARNPVDGSILVSPGYERLEVMTADGTRRRSLLRLHGERQFTVGRSPWSPDGKQVAVSISPADCEEGCVGWSVWILDLATSRRRLVLRDADEASWSADGKTLAFTNPVFPEYTGADHIAVPPHYVYLAPANGGTRVRLVRGRSPMWKPAGRQLVYSSERTYHNPESQNEFTGVWATPVNFAKPNRIRRLADIYGPQEWSLSPNGTRVVYTRFFGGLGVVPIDGRDPRELAAYKGVDTSPVWSPDGKLVAWSRFDRRGDLQRLMMVRTDGSARPREVVRTGGRGRFAGLVFSADGKRIIFSVAVSQ